MVRLKRSKQKKSFTKQGEDDNDEDVNSEISENEFGSEYEAETLPKWYHEFEYDKYKSSKVEADLSLRSEAERILIEESGAYKTRLYESKSSQTRWMLNIAQHGTSSDKIASLTIMIQEAPVYNISAITSLINMVKVAKKSQFNLVVDNLTELFLKELLRPSKKLKVFEKQPWQHLDEISKNDHAVRRKLLCYWMFEDKLKGLYTQFIQALNLAAQDTLQANREKAISAMTKLLQGNIEQEKVLLVNLINKFGDKVNKVASKAVYALERFVYKFDKKKPVILNEVEKLIFRAHISPKAQYYGICFLSQFKLSSSDKQLARDLIVLYFSFFKACVKTGTIDSRLMGALLVGVNRAYPFAIGRNGNKDEVIPREHIDTMFKLVHLAPFKISLQTLVLLLQISNCDRFYSALYKKLLDKELMNTSHQGIWLHLMHKAINKDENINRMKAFIKRILQICQYFPVPLACGTLVIISQLFRKNSDLFDNECFTSGDVEIKDENEEKMVDDDTIIKWKDFDDDDVEIKEEDEVVSSWYHRTLMNVKHVETPKEEKKFVPKTTFDPQARNPLYAGGENAIYVELLNLSKHFHPSVALFAQKLLKHERIIYPGDPLMDFTLIRFLERFSFKNPKKYKYDQEDKQELFRTVGSSRKHYKATGMRSLPVQSEQYLKQPESSIPVDELFLYRYLREKRGKRPEKPKKEEEDDSESDVDSVGSEEFNEYMDTISGKDNIDDIDFADDVDKAIGMKKKNKNSSETGNDSDDESDEDEDNFANNTLNDDGDDDDDEGYSDLDDMDEEDEDDDAYDYDTDEDGMEFDDDELNEEMDGIEDDNSEEEEGPLEDVLKRKIKKDFMGMSAVPSDKFAEMLEEAGKNQSGGYNDILNKDNAGEKQLKWEASKFKQQWKGKGKRKWEGKSNNNTGKKKWKKK